MQSGRVRALVVRGEARSPLAPEVPTAREAAPSTPEELARTIATGRDTMGRIIAAANIWAD